MRGRLARSLRSFVDQTSSMERTAGKMTLRTFEEGTPWPLFKGNTLRLYSMRFCPYAQRARLVLEHKNIPYETVNVHLKRKPSWLLERNPKGRVPVLEHPDGRVLFDSLVVSQYLDEVFPQRPLTPADPYRKARDRLLPDFCDKLMMATYQMLFTEGSSQEARVTFHKGFTIYEAKLKRRLPDGPFFGGSGPAMVDYMLWPWFERLPMLNEDNDSNDPSASRTTTTTTTTTTQQTTPLQQDSLLQQVTDFGPVGVSASQFPLLHRWMAAMFTVPAVRTTMFDLATHARFGRSQLTADPEYDMGLEGEPPVPSSAKL
ncbi:pyrimidodiazepine synthase-like [Babylonia areolata]|uniref:pyrimidodiazepine synthase-like n=1 Tax=Babylonia areolata TaxID=304850 RepID=UPI003FD52CC6